MWGSTQDYVPNSEELSHLLPPGAHQLLVLPNPELLAIHDARAFRPGLVLVIWVLL